MPIHLSILQPRLAEGGKIKIGGLGESRKSRSTGREYRSPERYDHFVITRTIRAADGENFIVDYDLMNAVMDGDHTTFVMDKSTKHEPTKGRKLVRVPILLDSDIVDEVLPTRLAAYWGKRLFCSGTGDPNVSATRNVFDNKTKQRLRTVGHPCTCDLLHEPINGIQCKPNGTLWATVYAGENTTLGIRHSFRTTSWNSLRSMLASLQTIQRRIGTLVNIPLYLVLREERVRDRNDEVRRIHVAHVELQVSDLAALRQLQREALESVNLRNQVSAIAGRPIPLGLPIPGSPREPRSEQARIGPEFYPHRDHVADTEQSEDEARDDGTIDYNPETGEVYDNGPSDDAETQPPASYDQRSIEDRGPPQDAPPVIDTTARERPTGHSRRNETDQEEESGPPPQAAPEDTGLQPASGEVHSDAGPLFGGPQDDGSRQPEAPDNAGTTATPEPSPAASPASSEPPPNGAAHEPLAEDADERSFVRKLLTRVAKAQGANQGNINRIRDQLWKKATERAECANLHWAKMTKMQALKISSALERIEKEQSSTSG